VSILYVFLAKFWVGIAAIVLALPIYLIARLRARRLSAEESLELATKSIAAGLAGAVMLGMAILVPTTLILFVLSTFDLSGWRALPVFLWGTLCLICGIAGLFDLLGRPRQGQEQGK
jgi:energy-converting hydrogenase Eha subunit A